MATSGIAAGQASEPGKFVSFEQFLAAMDRLAAEAAEQKKEAAERKKESDRRAEEADRRLKEVSRQIEATNKQIGKLGGRYGEMVEAMVMPNLVKKFREMDFEVNRASRGSTIEDRVNGIAAEIDILLENGDKVMIVEVKSKPTTEDVNDHVKRMEKVRLHADLHGDKRKFRGAIAGMVVNDAMRDCILGHGFYVIEPSGDTFNSTEPKGQYSPREW
jgi:hypothetical protein